MNSDKLLKSIDSQKAAWVETKKEEDNELNFASENFSNEPWMWCRACKLGVCEEPH